MNLPINWEDVDLRTGFVVYKLDVNEQVKFTMQKKNAMFFFSPQSTYTIFFNYNLFYVTAFMS